MHNEPGTNRDNEGMLEHKDKISKIMIIEEKQDRLQPDTAIDRA